MVKIVTHSGGFHADEVFAVATILLHLGEKMEVQVIRTRDNDVFEEADYLIDVGGVYDLKHLRFDHHQPEGAGKRENGIPYASFGLVWKEFGSQISGSNRIAEIIEKKLVMYIDALDNGTVIDKPLFEGVRSYTISDYLYSYWIDENSGSEEIDRVFKRVVSLAKDLITREIKKYQNIIEQEAVVEDIYNKTVDKRIIVMDKGLAWGRILSEEKEPLIAVYPSSSGQWYAKAVSEKDDFFKRRVSFPEEWAGLSGADLQKLSGVEDASFCHRKRFLAVAHSKEGAIALAKKALEG